MKIFEKHIKIIIIFLLIIIFVSVLFIIKQLSKDAPLTVQREVVLEELVKEIDESSKMSILLSFKEPGEETVSAVSESLQAWEKFVFAFKDNQPIEYQKTRDWDRKLMIILEHARKADELVKENKLAEAGEETKMLREIFKKIKEENGILDISDEMIAFYEAGKKVIEAGTREEVALKLPDLKYRFTILKEYSIDEDYDELIKKLEEIIAKLDKFLDGPDFRKAQSELEPVFMELYLKY
ncbi:hypothetical protein KAJ89_00445 [Candidatus Parcubacteria bacterium]|nr:hypothetical protein [Candidatus Parcubacteria bacterium]